MFNIKKTILNLGITAVVLWPAGAYAQTQASPFGQTLQQLPGGSTVYLTNTGYSQTSDSEVENNIAKDAEGNIYIAGTFNAGSTPALFVKKVNPVTGAEIWASTVTSAAMVIGRGAAVYGDYLYVLAKKQDSTSGFFRTAVIKYEAATGNRLWVRTDEYSTETNPYDIVADADFVYVAGSVGAITIFKFPTDGVSAIAAVKYLGGYNSTAYGIALSGGNLFVAGTINLNNGFGNEIWLGKFTASNLAHVWASTYTPSLNHMTGGYDEARAVKVDGASGNIYVVGYYQSQNTQQDIWLGKYDQFGQLLYTKTKNGPSNGMDRGYGLALDDKANIYVTGKVSAYSTANNQRENLWLGKYSPSGTPLPEFSIDFNLGQEVGYDVEVSSLIVSVGGGFMDKYGLLTLLPEQFGAPQSLFAAQGYYPGSVKLSWNWEATGLQNYAIQYSTNPSINWDKNNANIVGSFNNYTVGDPYWHTINGLHVKQGYSAGVQAPPGPVYYFKVWVGGVELNSTPVSSVPNAPYSAWTKYDRAPDSFFMFDNAWVPSLGMARDGAGNTFVAYASGGSGTNQGLALTKVNQYGMAEWTSFYNSTTTNGRFNANRMLIDASSNIYVAGTAFFDGSSTMEDAWLVKFNSTGEWQWDRVIAGPGNDQFTGLALNANGSVVYAAGSLSANTGQNKDMLIARYYTANGGYIQAPTFNYNAPGEESSPTEIWGLALDSSDNIYAGGYTSRLTGVNGTASEYDRDAVVLKLSSDLIFTSSHVYVNSQASGDVVDGITGLVFSGGYLYASGIKTDILQPQFWGAKLNPANWESPEWENTHFIVGVEEILPAAAYGLRLNPGADSVYVSGYETRPAAAMGGTRNILLRKYSMTTGALGWTKSVPEAMQGEGSKALGLELGGDGYFYLNSLFKMAIAGGQGQPGVARIAEPMSGIAAGPGYKPCSVDLSWVADAELPSGTTFYVRYATYSPVDLPAAFDANAAEYSFFTTYNSLSGNIIRHIVPGLEAGNGAPTPGYNNIDSPKYHFKLSYMRPGDEMATQISESTSAVANTPGTGDRVDNYGLDKLFIMNNAHGERFPLVRDASGNIYTAGYFNAWNGNSYAAYVRKFAPSGQQLWTRYYSDEYNNSRPVINALALDASGNLYAAGTVGSDFCQFWENGSCGKKESPTGTDLLLIKYSASTGRMQWARSYDVDGGNFNDYGYGLAVSPSNVFVAGKYYAVGEISGEKAFLAALDTGGGLLASATEGGSGENAFNAVTYDSANDRVIAAGKVYGGSDSDGLARTYTFDGAFSEGVDITTSTTGDDEFYAVKVDTGNAAVYLAGAVGAGSGSQDAFVAKLDSADLAGDPLWARSYNSASQNIDEAYGLALDGLGGVYISGIESQYDMGQGKNVFIRKYSGEAGELIWSRQLNSSGSNEDTAGGISVDASGTVFAAVDAVSGSAAPTGGTNNYGTTISGSGYFRHVQTNMAITNPKLTVRVNRVPNQGLEGVSVAVMSFNQTGGMDPNGIMLGVTNSSGAVTMSLPAGRNYMVAISSHNMVPTISEQISDPNGNFFIELNADTTRQYFLSYRPASADLVNRMYIYAEGLVVDEYVMGEVVINNTGEKAAYGIIKATATKSTIEIPNLGAALNGVYNMGVNVPARNRARQLFMTGDFPAVNWYKADDMNAAMTMATGFEVGGSTNPPSLTGKITDLSFSPLEGARVRLEKNICTAPPENVCTITFTRENLTDVSGRYSFYDVPTSTSSNEDDKYNLNIGKAGYESSGDRFLLSTPPPGTFPVPNIKDFQLDPATYTLTGVLSYNGLPLPNAVIMVSPDGRTYSGGSDSYRFCKWGGCGIRADARVRTGADGSFTVSGMTDGNARIEASFEGGWRSLNAGNSDGASDDWRVTISSQGAVAPSADLNPANYECSAGRVWVMDSSGTCVTADNVVFNIVPEDANTGGELFGDLTFISTYTVTELNPLVISTSSPLTVMAQETGNRGSESSQMGFTSLSGTFTENTTSYSIILSTGAKYSLRVFSADWAKAASFKMEVELSSSSPSSRQDMSVVRAGGLRGVMKQPDGSSFKPVCSKDGCSSSAKIVIQGVNVDVKEDKKVDENGEFEFPNVAPGTYKVTGQPEGDAFIWAPPSMDSVSVTEGRTTDVKLQLESGLALKPQIFGLPALSTPAWGYFVIGVESGEEMTQKKVTELFFSEPKYKFNYSTSTGWDTKYMPAGQYDFYLMMSASYDPGGGDSGIVNYTQFANFIGRVKGMSVQRDSGNPNAGTAAQPIPINILGAVGQAEIAGTVQGASMFTPPDMERMFANFAETFNVIPAIMLYDTAGDLHGFANGMPSEEKFTGFMDAVAARDGEGMKAHLAANPLSYGIWGLPPGRYTAVFANPNYPPMAKEVTLPENASYVFNFDNQQVITGSISGVVRSSATPAVPLGGARVYLKHRTVEKFTLTNSSGAFSLSNLPAGIYRLEVSRNGYVTAGEKTGLSGSDSASFNIYLKPSESKLSGRLFMSKFPAPVTRAGVQVVAYDETNNVESPGAYLPKTEVQTDASGNFEITGVVPGHLYKLSAFYQGKLPEVLEVVAKEGNTVISDITLKDTPPQIVIKVKRSGDSVNKVDVVIKSPKQLISIPNCQYTPGQAYNADTAVTLMLVPGPGNTFLGQFNVTSGQQFYNVRFTAGDGNNKMVKEFVYDQVSNAKTEQYIQQESLAGGEVQMDKETEEYSGIELDPGALSYSTATVGAIDFANLIGGFFSALPSVRTVKTAKGNLSISDAIQGLMASEIYNMDLSNASANKPFTLTLKYDKEKGSGSQGLRIYQYDDATGTWKEVPGNYTVDPMTGIVSVDVGSLTNASEGTSGVATPLGRKRFGMSAVVNGRYVPSATGSTTQSGRFAVFTAPPLAGVAAFSSAFEVYTMPNPFSLKSKTVTLSGDALTNVGAYPTTGAVIKYNLPAGKSGNLKFVIYNLAGEKVRTIDQGAVAGGQVYYSEWDGKNDTNQNCASGVYFMLTYLDGKKLGVKAHKMAIIK